VRVRAGTAVEKDEIRFAQGRIVQNGLQFGGARAGEIKLVPASLPSMDMHGQAKAPRLARNFAEEVVLDFQDFGS